eukprot:TRINITY_DN21130_c0_g1_i1.p1 TRINITY_DN21130_c0_g1~~TRINITY_DN21130_c0_g1_i1.p1  ORF type:complete len:410 (-),score=54.10 TRINITY_DN21130_c0_g1_i1:170-1333(-)
MAAAVRRRSRWRSWAAPTFMLAAAIAALAAIGGLDKAFTGGCQSLGVSTQLRRTFGMPSASGMLRYGADRAAPRGASEDSEVADTPVAAVPAAPQRSLAVQLWAVLGVFCYLTYGVKKVIPIVQNGFRDIHTPFQWALLVATLSFFGYAEGYKGFQKGFSPRVVSRAWAVSEMNGDTLQFYDFKSSAKLAKTLLKQYGVAYLLTSVSLSLCSFYFFYSLVGARIDVDGLLSFIGVNPSKVGGRLGRVAIAYALHKAASFIRFPPTVALTPVVARCIGTAPKDSAAEGQKLLPFWHKALAPMFCIGYFHGTKKRVISSWAVTTTIFLVVIGVRKLANPYRAIIDAGVVVGLSWGAIAVLAIFIKSRLDGKPPAFDPSLPEDTPYTTLA